MNKQGQGMVLMGMGVAMIIAGAVMDLILNQRATALGLAITGIFIFLVGAYRLFDWSD